ncbi:hypothetical protein HPB50_016578 [Hyalomma asiaticum]|uniref:Uncharacterized protein n=1 Tax=Hyalomma asiaticum TaxID=266040 RepID=A0ACB7SZB6_HYAAI|nr:hypothetical protein HPB50_016578 [Hyalomma asiaticum]
MSVAEPAPAAGGGKQDPVVPDAVVYVCSLVIVVMVVGGVIGLSILMKQRLAAPAGPGAPPPIAARLASVEDSDSNDFKVFNDDDPFHKDETVKPSTQAAVIREIGVVKNISEVGAGGLEITAKKNAAKAARNDTIDGDLEKGDIQAPEGVNLSDVSEGAHGDADATKPKAVIKVIKPAEIGKPSEVDKAGSHNQTAPTVVSGSSANVTTSNTSALGNPAASNATSDMAVVSSLINASLTDASSSSGGSAVGDSPSDKSPLSGEDSAGSATETKAGLPAADSSAVDKSSSGAKSPADIHEENKLSPAKPSAADGLSANEASVGKAAVNQSISQGPQSGKAPPIAAPGANDKTPEVLSPADGSPARTPPGDNKSAAAADSAEKPLAGNLPSASKGTSADGTAAKAVPSGTASDAVSPAKKEAGPAPEASAPHAPPSSAGSGTDSPLAPGPSAQRPLFCDVRKSISRPLASYCTHILFGRLPLVKSNGVIMVGDFDSATQEQLHLASVVRPGWPHVSLMTTLGGGSEKDDIAMAKAFESGVEVLDELATEAANLVRKRGLDGLNVHWTVPDLEGDVEAYAAGLVAFIKKLRKELGPSSIITVVLPNEPEERNSAFNVRELQPLVDFLFVSTHDTFSPYSTLTHFNGPAQDVDTGGMFTAIADVMKQLNANQSRQLCFTFGLSGVAYKVDSGAPLAKYVPLVESDDPSGVQNAPNDGQLPKEGRAITYDEVCKLNLTCHKAQVEKSCYDKVGDTWYGYVNEEAVASKAKWILKDGWENLCVVAWNVDADDVKGSCRGDAAASYPLLRSLSQATAALAY